MSGNFDGIKTQKYGVEVERTGLTRADAAKAISKILGGSPEHLGGSYDKYNVRDGKDRKWSIVYDSSIRCVDKSGCSASRNYAVELVTPVLEYEDMPLLQEVVRAVRKAGGVTGAEYQAGIHVHIDGAPYTAQSLRNLVNIFASKENFLFDMLQVSPLRETYCQKVDRDFLEKLNKQKPKTIEEIQRLWYNGDMNEVHHHYSSTRYRACNLHSFFANGKIKIADLYSNPQLMNENSADEFTRMYYVACSRAKEDLYVHILDESLISELQASINAYIDKTGKRIDYEFII